MRELFTYFLQEAWGFFFGWWVIIGLMSGSFVNVVAYRLPRAIMSETERDARKYSLLFPSSCPSCGSRIKALDNIPVLSWLVLRAQCRYCAASIPPRYLLVELAGGVIAAGGLAICGASSEALVFSIAGWFLLAAALCDYDSLYIPSSVSSGLMWMGLLSTIWELGFVTTQEAVLGAAAGFVLPWALNCFFRAAKGTDGLGYGDFHLLAGVGAVGGGTYAWLCLAVAAICSLVYALLINRNRLAGASSDGGVGPFGPWISGAAFLCLPTFPSLPKLSWLLGLGF